MLDSVPKWVLAVGVAALLFLVLAGSRWLFTPSERGAISVQSSYDELAAALEQDRLLPLQDIDELLMAYTNIVMATGQLREPQSLGGGMQEVRLGQVMRGVGSEGQIDELWLNPQQWREIRTGRLRQALQTLSRLSLRKQAGTTQGSKSLPVMQTSFNFTVTVRSDTYTFTPFFDGQKCNQILVKRQ